MSAQLNYQPLVNLAGVARPQLEAFFVRRGARQFHARQFLQWLYQRGVINIDGMTDLSKALRANLQNHSAIQFPDIISEQISADGAIKWLLGVSRQNHDHSNAIETVYIPESSRGTLCISSQVGCALDCTFCATARQGFNRNLSAAEIIGQVWLADQRLRVLNNGRRLLTNVVFMGMGEPLLNFNNIMPVINLLLDDYAYGMSKRKVTVSTSGIVPKIDLLSQHADVSLAVSLHAPSDAVRNQLVPINRKYPIKSLLAACRRYLNNKNRKASVTFEYVMLDGVNDSLQQAEQLAALLKNMRAKINLIPFNSFAQSGYQRSSQAAIERFSQILMHHGLIVITRRPRGEDIAAACGQLAGKVVDRAQRASHYIKMYERARLSRRIEAKCV